MFERVAMMSRYEKIGRICTFLGNSAMTSSTCRLDIFRLHVSYVCQHVLYWVRRNGAVLIVVGETIFNSER
jgi:hypothetical protein